MKPKLLLSTVCFCFCFCFGISGVNADEYHYKNLINGAKAAGLGGAFTAVADDLTAMLYNPAGLSRSDVSSTASMNVLSWESNKFTEVFADGSDFERDSFTIIPSFLGVRSKYDNWDFGFSFAVTDFAKERTSTNALITTPMSADTQFIYMDIDKSAFQAGASVAYQLSEHWSVGSSLYFQYRQFDTLQGSGVASAIPVSETQVLTAGFNASRRITDMSYVVQPVLGILWKNEALSFGASVSKNIGLKRDYSVYSTIFVANYPVTTPASRYISSSSAKQSYPLTLTTGLSYDFGDLVLTADVSFYQKVDKTLAVIDSIQTPITRKLKQVVNYAVGVEYPLSKDYLARLGLFTDNTNGKIDPNIDFQRVEAVDLTGLAFSLETDLLGQKAAFGLNYMFGDGQVRYADIRAVEYVAGGALYPPNDTYDVGNLEKQSLVGYLSVNF